MLKTVAIDNFGHDIFRGIINDMQNKLEPSIKQADSKHIRHLPNGGIVTLKETKTHLAAHDNKRFWKSYNESYGYGYPLYTPQKENYKILTHKDGYIKGTENDPELHYIPNINMLADEIQETSYNIDSDSDNEDGDRENDPYIW